MEKTKKEKFTELTKGKPRKREEKFFARFSGVQLTAILLIILAATFMVQGVERYLEAVGKLEFLNPWLILIILSMILLTSSVGSITLGGVVSPLKLKRNLNLVSFITFTLGFVLFLASLFFLFIILI
jgi:hypothetical protein